MSDERNSFLGQLHYASNFPTPHAVEKCWFKCFFERLGTQIAKQNDKNAGIQFIFYIKIACFWVKNDYFALNFSIS